MQVGADKPADQADPGAVHGHAIEPVRRLAGGDQDHLRAIGLGQPLGQGFTHRRRGEVLVLQIDRLFGGGDRGQRQGLALADFRLAAPARVGAGNADHDVGEGRLQTVRPGRGRVGRRRMQGLASRPSPALPEKLAQRPGRPAVDQRHHLAPGVEIPPGARPAAPEILVQVLGRVPAVEGQVGAAAEGDGVVDDHHFLVVAGAEGMGPVQHEVDAGAGEHRDVPLRIALLREGDRQGGPPAQHPHVDALGRQLPQDLPQAKKGLPLGIESRVRLSNAQLRKWTERRALPSASLSAA